MTYQRLTAYLQGVVQGVGMRYFVQVQARQLGLEGYVRNLPDGRVEVVAEGPTSRLQTFLELLRHSSVGKVSEVESHWSEYTGRWQTFSIAR